jgi:hypothetical protein
MTKDGALGLPADQGQPDNILAQTGPALVRASTVTLLVCLETSRFFVTQTRWLSFGRLLVNLFILHHESVTSSLRSSVHGGPGVLALASV